MKLLPRYEVYEVNEYNGYTRNQVIDEIALFQALGENGYINIRKNHFRKLEDIPGPGKKQLYNYTAVCNDRLEYITIYANYTRE